MRATSSCLTLPLWKELAERYPEWPVLQAFLESEEGGFLRISDQTDELCIIRYDKATSRQEVPHVRWFRSVVWDKVRNVPVSVAPPKATVEPFPYASRKEAREAGIVWEEYVDGFMIQCFRRVGDPVLHLTSRSSLDASGTFYSPIPFRVLCLEAVEAMGWNLEEMVREPDEEKGEVSVSLSLVVQHPAHHRVTPVTVPWVGCVHSTVTDVNGVVHLQNEFPSWNESEGEDVDQGVEDEEAGDSVASWIRNIHHSRPWSFRGLVAKDATGQRWRFPSEKYTAVRSLRGNEVRPLDRYARLLTQNLGTIYLEYYPEDIQVFSLFTVFMNDIVQTIHEWYLSLFIHKRVTWADVPVVYRSHLYAIHGLYLSHLRTVQRWVTSHDIRLYLTQQPAQRIVFLIRAHQEKYHSLPSAT